MMLLNLGSAALIAGDLDESRPRLAEALRIADQIDDRVAQFYLLGALRLPRRAFRPAAAGGAAARGRGHRADAGRRERRCCSSPRPLARAGQSAATALGAATFEAEFDAGKRLSRDAALGSRWARPTPARRRRLSAPPAPGPLGQREADVARLVADGLTNKQIGARLFISERTVDSHVRSILNKLGFSSRAQIAAWMTSPDK